MMTDIAIRVENLSKLYHIGAVQKRHDTLPMYQTFPGCACECVAQNAAVGQYAWCQQ